MILNILIIHEIDWINKVVFEPHHLSELFSKKGHNVFVIDCPDTQNKNIIDGIEQILFLIILEYMMMFQLLLFVHRLF